MALHCRRDGDRAPNRHDWAERISKPYIIMHGTLVCWAAFGSIRPAIARPPSFQRQPFATPICKEWSGSELGGPQRSRPDWPFREVVGLDLGAPSSRAGGCRRRQQGRGLHRQAATGAQCRWAEQVDEVLEAHLDAAVLRDHNVITNVPRLVATSTSEARSALTKNRTVAANSLRAGTDRESPDKSSSPPPRATVRSIAAGQSPSRTVWTCPSMAWR